MKVRIIHYEKGLLFDNDVEELSLPMVDGKVMVLPNHAFYFALLGKGTVSAQGAERVLIDINKGYVHVKNNTVVVLVR